MNVKPIEYTIEQGDTLSEIAHQFKVPVGDLIDRNLAQIHRADNGNFYFDAGVTIKIPASTTPIVTGPYRGIAFYTRQMTNESTPVVGETGTGKSATLNGLSEE